MLGTGTNLLPQSTLDISAKYLDEILDIGEMI